MQQTMKTASSDEELAFKQKERDVALYTRRGIGAAHGFENCFELSPEESKEAVPDHGLFW